MIGVRQEDWWWMAPRVHQWYRVVFKSAGWPEDDGVRRSVIYNFNNSKPMWTQGVRQASGYVRKHEWRGKEGK